MKQLLHKLQNPQSFRIHLDEITDISDKVQLIVYCRVVDEGKTILEHYLYRLKVVGFCATVQDISAEFNQFIEDRGLMGRSVSQLLPMEQQPCKVLLMELSEISKSFPLTVFQVMV